MAQIFTKLPSASSEYLDLYVDDGTTEDTAPRFTLKANGRHEWGDGTNAADIVVQRASAGALNVATGVLQVGGVPVVPSISTLAVTTSLTAASHAGRIIRMTGAGAARTFTLPAATGTGARFTFVVGEVNTSGYVINVTGNDIMAGNILTNSTGDTPDLAQPWITAADSDTITLNGTTSGGVSIGDFVELVDLAADTWWVRGVTSSSGTEVTPFSAAVT